MNDAYPVPAIPYGSTIRDRFTGFTGAVRGAYVEPRGVSYDVCNEKGEARYIPQENALAEASA